MRVPAARRDQRDRRAARHVRCHVRALLAALLLAYVALCSPRRAAAGVLRPEDGYRISVLTMGPGDAFVTRFGHDALLVERAGLPSLVYNFGMYTEQAIAPHHVLGGTLLYFLQVDYLERTLALYRAQNRTLALQELALDQSTAERLAHALSLNSRPENATYHYDFARDNCTTRVRDALDRALGGALRRSWQGPSGYGYRDHARRFTEDDAVLAFSFDLGLGRDADRPLDVWDDAFLPDRLAEHLRHVTVTDALGSHPLVLREATLFQASRAPTPAHAASARGLHALAGVAAGVWLFWLGRRRTLRVSFALSAGLSGAVLGCCGLAVLLLLGTDVHAATHHNLNALVCPAWAGALVPAGLLAAFGSARAFRALSGVALSALALAVTGALASVAGGQDTSRVALLVVPWLTGAWLGARAALRTSA